jgi:hypothetical protein
MWPRLSEEGGMWAVNYKDRVLQVIEVSCPYKGYKGNGDGYCIDIETARGEKIVAEYATASDADDAYVRFRRYAVRGGKTEAGTSLFIWPVQRKASEMTPVQLQEFAEKTK